MPKRLRSRTPFWKSLTWWVMIIFWAVGVFALTRAFF